MVDLVRGYESAALRRCGAYAGIVLEHFNYGDLTSYLTGTPYWAGRVDLPQKPSTITEAPLRAGN
jgi:hypothetical protein